MKQLWATIDDRKVAIKAYYHFGSKPLYGLHPEQNSAQCNMQHLVALTIITLSTTAVM
jgi:hypothetical protein